MRLSKLFEKLYDYLLGKYSSGSILERAKYDRSNYWFKSCSPGNILENAKYERIKPEE